MKLWKEILVTVPLSSAEGLESAKDRKIEKYKHLGSLLPLVFGSLGSWRPSNDAISLALRIPGIRCNNLKRKKLKRKKLLDSLEYRELPG